VWLNNERDSFYFPYNKKPDLINVDGDKIVLCQKKDNKTLENFVYQYKHAGLYLDRREAIEFCSEHQDNPLSQSLLKQAMKDPYFELRNLAMNSIEMDSPVMKTMVEPVLLDLATNDPDRTVQATAIGYLGTYKKAAYKDLFVKKASDSSYSVAGNALTALSYLDEEKATQLANEFSKYPAKGDLLVAMSSIFVKAGDVSKFDFIIDGFDKMPMSQEKFDEFPEFATMLLKVQDTEQFKKGVDALVRFREGIPAGQKEELSKLLNDNFLKPIGQRKQAAGMKEQADYILSKIPQ
jgi:aminopeptidase N